MKFYRMLPHLLAVFAAAVLATGCIKEDTADCPDNYLLRVRAYAADQTELTATEVCDVTLYLFDGDGCFLRQVETALGRAEYIDIPKGETIQVVAWGNLGQGGQACPVLTPGDLKAEAFVTMRADTRAAAPCLSPDDLFHGQISVSGSTSGDIVVPITRVTGSMAVTVRKLKEWSGFADDDFSIVVRETCNSLDFEGRPAGTMASYRPSTAFSGSEFSAPAFNMIPGEGLCIDIYHAGQLIYTAPAPAPAGTPIDVMAGCQTNVLIDFAGSISVSVSVKDWGQSELWKNF